jgi:sugar lactone lactonase YvrE
MAGGELAILVDGLVFPECPRWRVDRLWLSDVLDHRVIQMSETGRTTRVARFATRPAGLGWLPDGRLLVVSMEDRRVLSVDGDRVDEFADLRHLAVHECNDMVVDRVGHAYVGHVGRTHTSSEEARGDLILVQAGAPPRVVASALRYPNGCVVTPDSGRLILAEFDGDRLLSFGVEEDGSLTEPRVFAELDSHPDGICLDAEGAVWVASPRTEEVIRVHDGGAVMDRIAVGRPVYAVALGGADGRFLYLCTAPSSNAGIGSLTERRGGRIEATRVAVPGVSAP